MYVLLINYFTIMNLTIYPNQISWMRKSALYDIWHPLKKIHFKKHEVIFFIIYTKASFFFLHANFQQNSAMIRNTISHIAHSNYSQDTFRLPSKKIFSGIFCFLCLLCLEYYTRPYLGDRQPQGNIQPPKMNTFAASFPLNEIKKNLLLWKHFGNLTTVVGVVLEERSRVLWIWIASLINVPESSCWFVFIQGSKSMKRMTFKGEGISLGLTSSRDVGNSKYFEPNNELKVQKIQANNQDLKK